MKKIFYVFILSLIFSLSYSAINAACYCLGSTLSCYSRCEGYAGVTQNCLLFCTVNQNFSHVDWNVSGGSYCLCCDELNTYSCACGCSGGACNSTCTAGWGSCSSGDTNSSDSYACGSRTYTNSCCSTSSENCWCDCGCTPGAAPLCPSGTSETASSPSSPLYPVGVTDYHSTPQTCCDRDRGNSPENCSPDQSCNSRTCYCNICTPALCPTLGYYSSSQFYSGVNQGKVPNSLTAQCRNGNDSTPSRTTLCSLTYRDCYCTTCLKSCPNGLYNTAQTASPNLILSNFRECTNDCGVQPLESEDDCYEAPSPQPVESFRIVTDDPVPTPNGFDFLSLTHTGDFRNEARQGDLNDPLLPIKMEAKYTDSNGASDIEGMFVWFREVAYSGVPGTPVHISTTATPQAPAADSWGFMLRRSGTDWVPYVPAYGGATSYWQTAALQPTMYYSTFFIAGTNQQQMVEVSILNKPVEVGNEVTMQFSLRFSTSTGTLFGGAVAEGDYNILLMGLDRFSFTPYDNYQDGWTFASYWTPEMLNNPNTTFSPYWQSNQLRYRETPTPAQTYARAWVDTGSNWVIDRTHPVINSFDFGSPQAIENRVRISWSVSDTRNIHSVVGNIYTTGGALAREITLSVVNSSHSVSLHSPNPFIPTGADAVNTARIEGDWSFRVAPNISSTTNSGTLDIDVGENTVGLFQFYLTVFDDAGNYTISSTPLEINLTDWFVSAGGLAYSSQGSYFSTKDGTFTSGILPPYLSPLNPGLVAANADYSSELWAEGANESPSSLEKSSSSRSYNITRYLGNDLNQGYYPTLERAYDKNRSNLGVELTEIVPAGNTLLGTVSSRCPTDYCVFNYPESLTVGSATNPTLNPLRCDKQTLIFVKEDLVINPPLYNVSAGDSIHTSNGCIFVVEGSVTINPGSNVSSDGTFRYDKIHGYILSDGLITVVDERPKATAVIDGVYINGGLSSSYDTGSVSIVVDRYLRLVERLSYPVLAVDYHPKYGVLGGLFFANDFVMQPVEVGIKP